MGYHCGLGTFPWIYKYETDYILEDCKRECHLKKDTAMCDSFEIDCIDCIP